MNFIMGLLVGAMAGVMACYLWKVARLQREVSNLLQENTRLSALQQSAVREKELVEKNLQMLSSNFPAQFAQLAQTILDDKTKGLDLANSKTLSPLKEAFDGFVKKVADMEDKTGRAQSRLETKLEEVIKSTAKIDESAVHLTNAIKGESIVRGSWGEETLKRILDAAGMKEGLDYEQQVADEGKRVDVQVHLPNDRFIIIDSKTLFNHYVHYFNAQDAKEKETALAEHVKDVKKTIKELSAKKYYKKFINEGEKVQPDYTLMFVYPESALLAAVEAEPDILNEAWKNNIALVSATSLMSTLKMVSKLWDIDKQHEYMEDLKEDILKLMEKFNDFLVNFAKAEQAVNNAAETMKIARGHVDGNKGAFLPVAQRIVDIYEVPVTKTSARLLKKMDYDYSGGKNKKSSALPPEAEQIS